MGLSDTINRSATTSHSRGTHVDGKHSIVPALPACRLAQDESLREQAQQHALRQKHQRLPIDREDPSSKIEVQPREQLRVGCGIDGRGAV